jgi:hypothetical protein
MLSLGVRKTPTTEQSNNQNEFQSAHIIFYEETHNAGLQLRRAISIQLKEPGYLRRMLSRRQLQGFVGQRPERKR